VNTQKLQFIEENSTGIETEELNMEEADANKLRNIPQYYDNVLLLGEYKLEPDPCNTRLEYKDLEIEKQNFSKIKEEFQTLYSFENCKLTGAKVSWAKLNYVKIAGCTVTGSSFTKVELSYGEGISDSRMEKGKIRNFRIHNMPVYRSTMTGIKFEEEVYLHNISLVECTGEKLHADDLMINTLKLTENKITDLQVDHIFGQIIYSKENTLCDVSIGHGRIQDGKFIGDKLEKVKFTEIKFKKCYFKGIDFKDTEFENCSFNECLFDECLFSEEQAGIIGVEHG